MRKFFTAALAAIIFVTSANTVTVMAGPWPQPVVAAAAIEFDDEVIVDGLTYALLENGTAAITGKEESSEITDLVIPETIEVDGAVYTVIYVSNAAFRDSELTSVVLAETIVSIGNNAFRNNLITELVIPASVTEMGNNAFRENLIVELVIPETVIYLGSDVFRANRLISVTIPDTIEFFYDGLFRANMLTSVAIPGSVTFIDDDAFMDNHITSLFIPSSVEIIERIAFRNNHLTSIVIPDSVQEIGERTLDGNRLKVIWTDIGNGAALAEMLDTYVMGAQTTNAVLLIEVAEIESPDILFDYHWEFYESIKNILDKLTIGQLFRWDNSAAEPAWLEIEDIGFN